MDDINGERVLEFPGSRRYADHRALREVAEAKADGRWDNPWT